MPSIKLRLLKNGDKFAPHRGKPPACPDGYERDAGDPFLFHPIIEPCNYRSEKSIPRKCCRTDKVVMWCKRDDVEITSLNCMKCSGVSQNVSDINFNNIST